MTTRRATRILHVSLPPEMYEAIEVVAQEENCTKSALIQEAFRHYQFIRRWRLIREWGRETAERFDIKTDEELEQLILLGGDHPTMI